MPKLKISDTQMIEISSFKTKNGQSLNVRKFYRSAKDEDGEWKPTKQGVSIPEDVAKKFIKGLKDELENIDDRAIDLDDKKPAKKSKKSVTRTMTNES